MVPYIDDIAMATILPALFSANVGALSIEFANLRHRHEYEALKEHPLPAHMLLNLGHPSGCQRQHLLWLQYFCRQSRK